MQKKLTLIWSIILLGLPLFIISQTITDNEYYMKTISDERSQMNQRILNPQLTPLSPEQLQKATPLSYFDVDTKFKISAKFNKHEIQKTVLLTMTDNTTKGFISYGTVTFNLKGKKTTLEVFVNEGLPEFGDNPQQLFIPFKDSTSGNETSENGRYLAIDAPSEQGLIELDFNKAYLTYNGYNMNVASVLPPNGNILPIHLAVGQRKFEDR